ncbi:aldehyde dehydrogenase [Galbibacter sp.]|uniref:aldehyde dehydrogenase n=1 Tax=Galbibacter sp. TaxID=2918471 RepID=UPI003A8D5823
METDLLELIKGQDAYFKSGQSLPISTRKQLLKALRDTIINREEVILKAIYEDLNKPVFEALATELNMVISEINYTLKHIDKWVRARRVSSNLLNFPSTAEIHSEPYGRVLIISPWNYPFALALMPLIGALAAGNTIVLKPSELSSNTTSLIAEILQDIFPKEHIAVVVGDQQIAQQLLEFRWDYIFFTGSTRVGKYVYQKAAEHLTPVTLELGGKSPCIVDSSASVKHLAKRIIWGKFLNAGQSCIAPDYLLVSYQVKDQLIAALKEAITKAYSERIESSTDYTQIINAAHRDRLLRILEGQDILYGGTAEGNFFAPTLVDEPNIDSPLMQQEIFGPILPIIGFQSFEQVKQIIDRYEKPLALYVFSNEKSFVKKVLENFSFGGGVVNDTMVHYAERNLPFGGVGHSGMGAYHGASSFKTFSHQKSIVKRSRWLDIPLRYPPYKDKAKWLKFIQRYL